MAAIAVIPARYGSTRFPGKPLAILRGKPMIQHVYERVACANAIDEVIVATDDQRIIDAVTTFHGKAVLTSGAARSGTERVAEVARPRTEKIVLNVQGDEPLIHPDMVDQLVQFLSAHAAVPMASLMTPLNDPEAFVSPHVVKAVVDRDGFALYFSRASIPYMRQQTTDQRPQTRDFRASTNSSQVSGLTSPVCHKHLGIYGYQRHFLLKFPHLAPTPLEQLEQLEQLRALEHGYRIKLLETVHDTIGVDTPEDLARVETILRHQTSDIRQETRDLRPQTRALW